jgi:hypothetical protein
MRTFFFLCLLTTNYRVFIYIYPQSRRWRVDCERITNYRSGMSCLNLTSLFVWFYPADWRLVNKSLNKYLQIIGSLKVKWLKYCNDSTDFGTFIWICIYFCSNFLALITQWHQVIVGGYNFVLYDEITYRKIFWHFWYGTLHVIWGVLRKCWILLEIKNTS